MRLVVQRVSSASVVVSQSKKTVGKIGKGLFILVGVGQGDSEKEAQALAEKISKLRVMSDGYDKMNLSVNDVKGEFLVVSQFTLSADTSKGNRPSFAKAAEPKTAKKIYEKFISELKIRDCKVQTGKFGEYMDIEAALDGPVTIVM